MSTIRRAIRAPARKPNAQVTASRFGRWYRSRPLIGGILIVIAGLEMIFSGQLDLGSIHIQVGIEGMQAMILPIALATLGVLIIAMPVHRMFYGIMSLVISIYALVGVNLGGFLVGTVVGIVGGIMCVSWAPRRIPVAQSVAAADESAPEVPDESAVDSLTESSPITSAPITSAPISSAPGVTAATRGFVIFALLLLVGASATGLGTGPSFADTPEPTASTEPTPSASADPSPSASADPTPSPSADPLPAVPDRAPVPTATRPSPGAPRATITSPAVADPPRDPDAPLAAIPSARLRSSAPTLDGARYLGTVRVALAGGSTATVLKITADHVAMDGFALDSADPAARILTTTASMLTLDGPVVIYCTSLSGVLADGSTVTFDGASPPPLDVALPSLASVTIGLVSVSSAAAALVGTVGSVR